MARLRYKYRMPEPSAKKRPKVIIVGGGFAGLNAAKQLKNAPVDVILIDRNNYHLFQPLLYQVATAGLSSVDIAYPIRSVFKKHKNIEVLMGEVTGIDSQAQRIEVGDHSFGYDYLVLAPGAQYNYFGHDDWERRAPGLKTITDAMEIRRKVLLAFEAAEMTQDPEERRAYLTFVLVGAGPTGTELAGSIAELAQKVLAKDFRRINPGSARIILVEAGPRILPSFSEHLIAETLAKLKRLKVEVQVGSRVEDVQEKGVIIDGKFVPTRTVLWCAGVKASPLVKSLGVELDRGGRVPVEPDLSVKGLPNVFVLGDAASFSNGEKPLPGIAPVAMQQGNHVPKVILSRIKGEKQGPPFQYFDKGQLATVGRGFALAQIGKIKTAGFFGWLLWLFVHLMYLVGFQNRILVLIQWAWNFFNYHRGARVIPTEQQGYQSKEESTVSLASGKSSH